MCNCPETWKGCTCFIYVLHNSLISLYSLLFHTWTITFILLIVNFRKSATTHVKRFSDCIRWCGHVWSCWHRELLHSPYGSPLSDTHSVICFLHRCCITFKGNKENKWVALCLKMHYMLKYPQANLTQLKILSCCSSSAALASTSMCV